ncbi:MAG: adenylate kinase [Acidimicrobiia bacterium]
MSGVSDSVRVIVFGRQGAGKGTQCARVAAHFGVPHVSTGEILRDAIAHDTVLGRAARKVLDDGGLVEDALMISLVQGRLGEQDARTRGYVLDGFPRTLVQAAAFDEMTAARPAHCAIDLEVPRDVVVARLLARRREDDTPEAINHRLDLYEAQTAPLIEHYRRRSSLRVVDGVGTQDEVFERVRSTVAACLA